jgi:hypothetical protein
VVTSEQQHIAHSAETYMVHQRGVPPTAAEAAGPRAVLEPVRL